MDESNHKEFQKAFDYEKGQTLLQVKHLKQYFRMKGGKGPHKYLKAVHDVSFDVYKGEVFGLVGESGCGKTTTGRDILKLYKITSGDILLDGVRIAAGTRWNEKEIKFTSLRAYEKVKQLKGEIAAIEASYQEKMKPLPQEKESELLALKEDMAAATAPLRREMEEAIAAARQVREVQSDKIKAARADERNFNKNIAKHEQERVAIKYASLLKKVADSDAASLTREELEQYEAYKKELSAAKKANIATKVQMIFQDPIASLNPRMTVRNIIAEGLIIQGGHSKEEIDREVARVLHLVGLVPEHANRYPHEFSGGQRQRIGIARAIIMHPELIVADEPVSALDVSVQAQVINLLNDLRNDLGLTIIFIAHNLSVVKYFCDRIAVMYYGNLVELAKSDELFAHPLHPYTKSLLSAVPYPDPIIEASRTRLIYHPETAHDYSADKPRYREIVPGHFLFCNDAEADACLKEYAASAQGEGE